MGVRFTKADVHELSLVAIPCNPEAVITAFKSLEAAEVTQVTEVPEVTGENPVQPVVKTPRLVKLDLSYRKY
jgi:hypothetical protein